MTAATRRLWLYGLLLLLPALAIGGLALGLLSREQARLDEREQAARTARLAGVESRARLIAENIELLVGDVQSALMTTLQEAPVAEPRAFLSEWQASNPLVRDVFRSTAEGRVVWGAGSEAVRAWLAQGPPWRAAAPAVLGESRTAQVADLGKTEPVTPANAMVAVEGANFGAVQRQDELARGEISNNIQQYKRARQEIQEVAKVKNYADVAAKSSSAQSNYMPASPAVPAPAPTEAKQQAFGAAEQMQQRDAGARKADLDAFSREAERVRSFALGSSVALRSGWTPWRDEAGLHCFGWRELADGTVIGLELRLDAIKARLGEVFPAVPEAGEAYALQDASGRDWHMVGTAGLPTVLKVPLAETALPGWTVAGRALAAGQAASPNGGFFTLGASLIGLLVLAILAAGALLLRQARRSEAEAVLKTSFVANVSHELKTPLTTIRLYAELLAQGRVREPAKQADYLATIGRETQRLSRLVGNVLDFSRLEQGRKKYECAPLDLAAELGRLADTHGPRLAEAGLTLRVDLPETLTVSTDRDAVEQIVLNLFDNVCKYAAEGGEVLLSLTALRVAGGRVELRVADRGPGVPADQRERIFEKFHRVDDRLTAEKGGAGLGLSIARQLALGLGGELSYVNRVGGGAEFVLTLP